MTVDQFFSAAFGKDITPFAYQQALAERDWPDALIAPTGLGKTAAVVLGWAWKLTSAEQPPPRRLVYCLPMRTLVEQTEQNVRGWLRRLGKAEPNFKLLLPDPESGVHVLMGGIDEPRWFEKPENPAVIIGTQDMLLSRALMRGYAMSRFRWPVDFALLHNDAQWVFDEVQLMGSGLATSTQLEGFRLKLETEIASQSLWVSATLHPDWLGTVDFKSNPVVWQVPKKFFDDAQSQHVSKLFNAPKPIRRSSVFPATSKKADLNAYATGLADETLRLHQENRTTLIVVNTVARAQAVHKALQNKKANLLAPLALIHSRFRPKDRQFQMEKLPKPGEEKNLIVVATQAIEAGVDLSSAVMLTELAPASSLVQRFGRVNRYGELNDNGGGTIHWVDLLNGDLGDSLAPPYDFDELKTGRERIDGLTDARPASLSAPSPSDCAQMRVIRCKDLLDLFDTDPDLTGFDVDIAPYIRDAQDTDIRVFWRDLSDKLDDQPAPTRNELCPVPIGEARKWLKKIRKRHKVFCIDPQTRANEKGKIPVWVPFKEDPWPGLVLMVSEKAGGYSPETGFDQSFTKAVKPVDLKKKEEATNESNDADPDTMRKGFVGLMNHTSHVVAETELLSGVLGLSGAMKTTIVRAAHWHDIGKAHPEFQARLVVNDSKGDLSPEGPLAKAPKYDRKKGRPYFRHELASALVFLQQAGWKRDVDLVAYLIAAHHGKVRLNLRPLPVERPLTGEDSPLRFARGVWEGDEVPPLDLGGGERWPGGPLTLSVMELGEHPETGASWTERTRNLLFQYGPFRLAWLEALVRIADWRASAKEEQEDGYGN